MVFQLPSLTSLTLTLHTPCNQTPQANTKCVKTCEAFQQLQVYSFPMELLSTKIGILKFKKTPPPSAPPPSASPSAPAAR